MDEGYVPKLDWICIEGDAWSRRQWCADGDGLMVVKRSSAGFTAMDQNGRKPVGRYKTLGAALRALETYMKESADGLFEYLLEAHPNLGGQVVA